MNMIPMEIQVIQIVILVFNILGSEPKLSDKILWMEIQFLQSVLLAGLTMLDP